MAQTDRLKIMCGVDYGTTFTGVSYVTSDKRTVQDIKIVRSWPGPVKPQEGAWKTPTCIAYPRENTFAKLKSEKWGFEVGPEMHSYRWTKLLLDKSAATQAADDPSLKATAGQGLLRLPSNRDAQGVCEDFLRHVYNHTIAKLEKEFTKATVDLTPVEYWITMPAIWSDQAQICTKAAALAAGFGARTLDSINMITEPEAAAMAAIRSETGSGSLNPVQVGEDILICDCGGGTVDIITYTVMQLEPLVQVKELLGGIACNANILQSLLADRLPGAKCGATYIDRNLHQLMEKRFGQVFTDLPFKRKGPGSLFMNRFEVVKSDFGYGDDESDRAIGPLRLNTPSSEFYDDSEEMVLVTYQDLVGLFDPVIDQIIKLIELQHLAALARGRQIDRIILVGGFGDSPYLNKKLKAWCDKAGSIRLMCPEDCQAAIAKGAALRGLEKNSIVTSKICRRHYGIKVHYKFREGVDDEKNAFFDDFDGEKRCSGMMSWEVAKGATITKDTKIVSNFHRNFDDSDSLVSSVSLYCSHLDVAPERADEAGVEMVGTIQQKFTQADLTMSESVFKYGKKVHRVEWVLQVEMGAREGVLRFSSWMNGREFGQTSITFDDQLPNVSNLSV